MRHRLDQLEFAQARPAAKRGGGRPIRMAFCKTAAGSGNTIICYLDVDGTGEEVTVRCTLIGVTDLSGCFPTLIDGLGMPVFWDYSYETPCWRSLWWFQGKEACPVE